MARHHIRAWATQTLYDCRDEWIEADSPEDAARLYRDAFDALEAGDEAPMQALSGHSFSTMLDPREIIDGETGFTLLTETGAKDRDVDPDSDGSVPAYNRIAPWSEAPTTAPPLMPPFAHIAAVARFAEAHFDLSRDEDDEDDDILAERDAGELALASVLAWLASVKA